MSELFFKVVFSFFVAFGIYSIYDYIFDPDQVSNLIAGLSGCLGFILVFGILREEK